MLIFFILSTIFFLATTIIFAVFLYRWANIVFLIEDTLSEALAVHERTISTFQEILSLQVVFDSPHVKKAYEEILADVKVCKVATLKIVEAFTRLNKKQYIIEEVVDKNSKEESE
jgi:hypothetical protein